MWRTHQHSAVVRSDAVALRATAFDNTAEMPTNLAAHVCVCVCLVVDGVSAPHTSLHGQVSLVKLLHSHAHTTHVSLTHSLRIANMCQR
jgi:hypothetical protein